MLDEPAGGPMLDMDPAEVREAIGGHVVLGLGPADVAALAVHIMINTALTGATYDVDGGQQFVF